MLLKNTQCLFVAFLTLLVSSFVHADTKQPPNILWLVVEDMSPIIAPYGDTTVRTPHISQLANEGLVFTNAYSTSGVCSPSRAALALGMYPSSVGANHMRTSSHTNITGLPKYEAVPPSEAKMLSHYMQEAGYYTTNNYKTDYQFVPPKGVWHESSTSAHWRNRPSDNTPFYSVFNFTTTHESGLFEPYGIRKIESRHYIAGEREKIAQLPAHHSVKTAPEDTPVHLPKNTKFSIPPYLPDTPAVRRDMWKMYNNLAETDQQIGAILAQLKEDGLYDNTIIVFYADHGGPLPRQKRLIYDSGLQVPLIVRFPEKTLAGELTDRLVSFVDFAPATLALAGVDVPAHMQGISFLNESGLASSENERAYIFAAADRFDEHTDAIRAVKDKRFKYIRNYRPEQGYYLPVTYREKIPTMQELLTLNTQGKLNDAQSQWFRSEKPREELFDTLNDPHELNNLAMDERYADKLNELRLAMDTWLEEIGDSPNLKEKDLIEKLWQGKPSQPVTAQPELTVSRKRIVASSVTQGAVIAYKVKKNDKHETAWALYSGPLNIEHDAVVTFIAHKIGFKPSEPVSLPMTSASNNDD